jgi:hypothetical protein
MSGTDALELMDEWGPEKIVCVSDPRSGMRGVLVIDNTARGIGKGGTRVTPTVTVGEVALMTRHVVSPPTACRAPCGSSAASGSWCSRDCRVLAARAADATGGERTPAGTERSPSRCRGPRSRRSHAVAVASRRGVGFIRCG